MNIRYVCEHRVLRDAFAHDPIKVVSKILVEKEKYIYDLFLATFEKNHEAFPYMMKDYKVTIKQKDQVEFIIIDMPSAFMEPTLCHKVILAYSMNLDLYQYYTLESGLDPLFGAYKVLCGWIENSHVAFTNIKDEEEDTLEDKITDIMMI